MALSAEARAEQVGAFWGREIARRPASPVTHGGRASLRYGVGGASAEAAPASLPCGRWAFRPFAGARPRAGRWAAGAVQCLFALMAELDDTNLLHRGGPEGLSFAQGSPGPSSTRAGSGRRVAGAGARPHTTFVEARLSPGGAADLLAVTLFLDSLSAERAQLRAIRTVPDEARFGGAPPEPATTTSWRISPRRYDSRKRL